MSAELAQNGNAQTQTEDSNNGSWEVVDDRPFECPNGHGLLEIESATSVWCPQCIYSRTVIDYVEE